MKYLAILLFLLGGMSPAFAQKDAAQAKIDSLEHVIATTKADTTKARSLCLLCWKLHMVGQMDDALEKGEAGLRLARSAGDLIGEASCLNSIGGIYKNRGDYARALEYYRQSLKLAREADNSKGEAAVLTNIGLIYVNKGDYARALDYYLKSLKIDKATGDYLGQGFSLGNIGIIYTIQGDYARALDYQQKSLKICEETGDRHGQANTLSNIGVIYENQGNYTSALEYYLKSLKITEETGNIKGQAMIFNNIGVIYDNKGDFARALDYHKKTLKVYVETGNIEGQSTSLHNIGINYSKQGDYARALDYHQKSLKIDEEIGDRRGVAHSLGNIALLKVHTNRAAEGRRVAKRAMKIATEIGALNRMELAAKSHARADSALGDWKSAYEHYKLFKQYSDSLNNESQSKEIGRLESKYEFDKEIEERERQEAEEAEKRAIIMWVAIGVFAALLLVAGLLTWGFRTKQKANKQLSLQNAEIKQKSEEISQQRDELEALAWQLTEQKAEVEKARDEIAEQHEKLEKAHEEITDSIDYASRIQRALLPAETTLQQGAEAYVYYKPRDVVSGDFYWMNQLDEDTALYSAADCTGHGVPGAFMSVLGATTLDTIVREYGETSPDKMLKLLDKSIRASLKQDETEDGSLDGMDLALIKLDKKNRKLYFSSAGRPLFLLRNGEILEYKGAKFPAGGAQHGEKEFPLIEIDLEPGDRIFMCSDGVTDQFGGPRKRKFSPRRLKETLLAHLDKDLQTQGAAFAQVFDDWQKTAKQLDDQLLLALAA